MAFHCKPKTKHAWILGLSETPLGSISFQLGLSLLLDPFSRCKEDDNKIYWKYTNFWFHHWNILHWYLCHKKNWLEEINAESQTYIHLMLYLIGIFRWTNLTNSIESFQFFYYIISNLNQTETPRPLRAAHH